jgi:hypothetical protein
MEGASSVSCASWKALPRAQGRARMRVIAPAGGPPMRCLKSPGHAATAGSARRGLGQWLVLSQRFPNLARMRVIGREGAGKPPHTSMCLAA